MVFSGRRGRFFTVVIVPHSDGEVVSFRLPILAAQVLCTLVAAFWIGLLVWARSYLDAVSTLGELEYLRAEAREHEVRLEALSRRAAWVEQELARLAELDRSVRSVLQKSPLGDAVQLAGVGAGEVPLGVGGGAVPVEELEQRLGRLDGEAERRAQSLAEVLQALRDYQEAYEATPTLWPAHGIITSDFGWRRDPFTWRRDFHPGVDIAAPYGAPVVATAGGAVVSVGWEGALGLVVVLDHGRYVTRYGHLARAAVQPGQKVNKGQVIAYVGSSGRSTGPHVHYEVYLEGQLVNPRHFLGER